MFRFLISIVMLLSISAQAQVALWTGNKLTPAQPFPGRVIAVESSWAGYRLFIESSGDKEKSYCIAQVWPGGIPHLDYKVIQKKDLPPPSVTTIFLSPSIEVDAFSWSMGVEKIGRIFGEHDALRKVTTPESDPQKRQGGNTPPNDGKPLK